MTDFDRELLQRREAYLTNLVADGLRASGQTLGIHALARRTVQQYAALIRENERTPRSPDREERP